LQYIWAGGSGQNQFPLAGFYGNFQTLAAERKILVFPIGNNSLHGGLNCGLPFPPKKDAVSSNTLIGQTRQGRVENKA